MSKNSGMGRKMMGSKMSKGKGKCDVTAHGEQCGREKKVSKGHGLDIKHG